MGKPVPFSQRRRCRLPSLPFNSAVLRRELSRRDGGLRSGANGPSSASSPSSSGRDLGRGERLFLGGAWAASSGMVSCAPVVPVVPGETDNEARAATVQASMSTAAVVVAAGGEVCEAAVASGETDGGPEGGGLVDPVSSGGGGTAP